MNFTFCIHTGWMVWCGALENIVARIDVRNYFEKGAEKVGKCSSSLG